MPSVIALAVITVMAMMGYFDGEYTYAHAFASLFLVTVGSLSVLNQFAIIREAQSVVKDLQAIDNLSRVAQNIASSGSVSDLHARAHGRVQSGASAESPFFSSSEAHRQRKGSLEMTKKSWVQLINRVALVAWACCDSSGNSRRRLFLADWLGGGRAPQGGLPPRWTMCGVGTHPEPL